jgi:hypothetical protein
VIGGTNKCKKLIVSIATTVYQEAFKSHKTLITGVTDVYGLMNSEKQFNLFQRERRRGFTLTG